jgi:hypothetical protein
MIDFSLHTTENFLIDNQRVFDLLAVLIAEKVNNVFIQRFYASRDGRGALLALKSNAEGPEWRRIRRTVARISMSISNLITRWRQSTSLSTKK